MKDKNQYSPLSVTFFLTMQMDYHKSVTNVFICYNSSSLSPNLIGSSSQAATWNKSFIHLYLLENFDITQQIAMNRAGWKGRWTLTFARLHYNLWPTTRHISAILRIMQDKATVIVEQ